MTSAYRSATMCILPVLGPRYLDKIQSDRWGIPLVIWKEQTRFHFKHPTSSKFEGKKLLYPSLYLKCLKAKLITSCIKLSITGWSGIWKREKKRWFLAWKGTLKIKSIRVLPMDYRQPLAIKQYSSCDMYLKFMNNLMLPLDKVYLSDSNLYFWGLSLLNCSWISNTMSHELYCLMAKGCL